MLHDFVELCLDFHALAILSADILLLLLKRDLAKAFNRNFGLLTANKLSQFDDCETI